MLENLIWGALDPPVGGLAPTGGSKTSSEGVSQNETLSPFPKGGLSPLLMSKEGQDRKRGHGPQ